MDFTTTEAANDLGGLARSIVDSVCTPDRQRELDKLDERFDRDLWSKLIDADILSTTAPESLGGGGFGVLEETAVLVALGRQIAAVPYLESVVLAAGALAKFGSEALQREWAAPAVTGEKILTVALDGEMGQGPVQAQSVGRRLPRSPAPGPLVGYGPVADAFLVPAETDSGVKVFLVAADDPGVSITSLDTTGHGSVGHLDLQGATSTPTASSAATRCVDWLTTRATLGRSAFQLGVLERALELTAEYAREREQFDRPIGSFQAVGQRLADGYIDIKGLRLTVTQAAWRLSEDLPADLEVGTAAFWAAEAGHRVAHTDGARARRRRHRHRPSGAPLLPRRQADRVRRRRRDRRSCCASAANWPRRLPDRTGDRRPSPTVAELLAPLVDVTDRGVYEGDSFVSWRDHLRAGARLAAALTARLDPAQAAARRRAARQHDVLLVRAGGGRPRRAWSRWGSTRPGAARPSPATSPAPTANWC